MSHDNPKVGARIEPLTAPYPEDIAADLARWMPPDAGIEPLALFRTLCRNGPLARAIFPLGAFQLSQHSSLDLRHRELVINRTSARLAAGYEWGVHATIYGPSAGLGEAELLATTESGISPLWTEQEALLIAMVDELVDSASVSDHTWDGLAQSFSHEQLLELLVLCGFYHLIGFVLNGVRVAPESWARSMPKLSGQPEV